MSKQGYIDRFLAVSRLYFQLTGKTSNNANQKDMEEMMELVDPDSTPMLCPDQIS